MRTKTPHLADRVLDAAARLFGTQRFHEARMDDIAAEAEVSKGTLYRYFKDKDELYLALLDRCSREMVQIVHDRVDPVKGARARLEAFIGALLGYFEAQPHLFDLISRAEVLRLPGQEFPWQKARDENLRVCLAIFEEGRLGGEFALRDPDLSALMLLGGLRAVIRHGPSPRPANQVRQLVEDFLHGAVADKRSAGRRGDTAP